MRDFITVAKALAETSRLRILLALRERELCVCQIVELLQLAPSTVSKHMTILTQARLVDSRKDGRWHYYRRPGTDIPAATQSALSWVDQSLAGHPSLSEDRARLKKIVKMPLEELCGLKTPR